MQQSRGLFDHLVGGGEQRRRHCEAERLRGLEIDRQLEFGPRAFRFMPGEVAGLEPRGPRRLVVHTFVRQSSAEPSILWSGTRLSRYACFTTWRNLFVAPVCPSTIELTNTTSSMSSGKKNARLCSSRGLGSRQSPGLQYTLPAGVGGQ